MNRPRETQRDLELHAGEVTHDRIKAAALHSLRGKPASYRRHLERYLAWAERKKIPAADAETLRAYVEELLERGAYSGASYAPILAGIRAGLRGAAGALLPAAIAAAFSETLRTVKAPRPASSAPARAFTLSPDEEKRVLEAMSERDALLFRFLLATGCRISEALGIRLERCRVEGAAALCPVMGKGGRARTVRIPVTLFGGIRSAFRGREYLFETSSRRPLHRVYATRQMKKGIERATGKHMSAHSLRHCFATRTIAGTRKIQAVSEYLGHASAAITLSMYTHERLSDADLGIE